jgi:hypothetical protein
MTKLCPRGKAAAKRKFKVYPSAYANAYASRICAGKIKDPSGVKRKDFKGRKPAMGGGSMNTRIGLKHGSYEKVPPSKGFSKYVTKQEQKKIDAANKEANEESRKPTTKDRMAEQARRKNRPVILLNTSQLNEGGRVGRRGGGLMEATARLQRQGLKGGGICKKGMNRKAVGKNS